MNGIEETELADNEIDLLAVSKQSDNYLVGECKFKGKPFRYSEYLDTITKLSDRKNKAEFWYYLFSESGFDEKSLSRHGRQQTCAVWVGRDCGI